VYGMFPELQTPDVMSILGIEPTSF